MAHGTAPGGRAREPPVLMEVMTLETPTAAAAPSAVSTPSAGPVLWTPRHVLVTASAQAEPHGRAVVDRLVAAGVDDVRLLDGDRLPPLRGEDERATYARAKRPSPS